MAGNFEYRFVAKLEDLLESRGLGLVEVIGYEHVSHHPPFTQVYYRNPDASPGEYTIHGSLYDLMLSL